MDKGYYDHGEKIRSKLSPYRKEILSRLNNGVSNTELAQSISDKYGLKVGRKTLESFIKKVFWTTYRGTIQAKNFSEEIMLLSKSGLDNKEVTRRINEKYSKHGLALTQHTVGKEICKRLGSWSESNKINPLHKMLTSAWTMEGMAA